MKKRQSTKQGFLIILAVGCLIIVAGIASFFENMNIERDLVGQAFNTITDCKKLTSPPARDRCYVQLRAQGNYYACDYVSNRRMRDDCYNKQSRCYDSDNGKNFEKKGTTTGVDITDQRIKKSDVCALDSNQKQVLLEYYCSVNNRVLAVSHECEGKCEGGVCVEEESELDSGGIKDCGVYDEIKNTGEDTDECFSEYGEKCKPVKLTAILDIPLFEYSVFDFTVNGISGGTCSLTVEMREPIKLSKTCYVKIYRSASFISGLSKCFVGLIKEAEASEQKCTDSDGGEQYFQKGQACFSNGCKEDQCIPKECEECYDHVREFICYNWSDDVFIKAVPCPYGCKDGACIIQDEENTCFDSDDGKDYGIIGWVLDRKYWSNGKPLFSEDACYIDSDNGGKKTNFSGPYISENFCSGDQFTGTHQFCTKGCVDRACVDGEVTCGNNICEPEYEEHSYSCEEDCRDLRCEGTPDLDYFTQSSIIVTSKGKQTVLTDTCVKKSVLDDYRCNGPGDYVRERHTCENGCKDGACVD